MKDLDCSNPTTWVVAVVNALEAAEDPHREVTERQWRDAYLALTWIEEALENEGAWYE
jgi:hypothetical protein